MSFQGLQPAYKEPKVTTSDDYSLLTLMNALIVRTNDLYTVTTALTGNNGIQSKHLLAASVNRNNIGQYINTLNYLADVIDAKTTALQTTGSTTTASSANQ